MAVEIMIDLTGAIFGKFYELLQRDIFHVVVNHFPDMAYVRGQSRRADLIGKSVFQNLANDAIGRDALRVRMGLEHCTEFFPHSTFRFMARFSFFRVKDSRSFVTTHPWTALLSARGVCKRGGFGKVECPKSSRLSG